ncbi:MAG TPA: protease inhibitor I42 family protein [Syntrophorhabdaceae bacterium]|nr:protease inhibitor I42 family protein [Syntrophorhabdaceae bacterium]HQM79996.1 protease inhibitor I42 family protein [Syntrophorhabdaceae bacterium]
MKRSALMVLATAFLLLSAANCAHTQEQSSKQKRIFSGSKTPFTMEVGDEFVLTLESNPSTGYLWQFAEKPDEGVVRFIGSEYRAAYPDRIGGGGHEIWTFRAAGKGKAAISLIYVRPWEKGVPPVRTAGVVIVVE